MASPTRQCTSHVCQCCAFSVCRDTVFALFFCTSIPAPASYSHCPTSLCRMWAKVRTAGTLLTKVKEGHRDSALTCNAHLDANADASFKEAVHAAMKLRVLHQCHRDICDGERTTLIFLTTGMSSTAWHMDRAEAFNTAVSLTVSFGTSYRFASNMLRTPSIPARPKHQSRMLSLLRLQGIPWLAGVESYAIWCFLGAEVSCEARELLQSSATQAWVSTHGHTGTLSDAAWLTNGTSQALTQAEGLFVRGISQKMQPPVDFTVLKQRGGETVFVPGGCPHCVLTVGGMVKYACESYDFHHACAIERAAQLRTWLPVHADYIACLPAQVADMVNWHAGTCHASPHASFRTRARCLHFTASIHCVPQS